MSDPPVSRPQPWAEPQNNQAMFERVAARYDRLNTLMSLGRHHAWRRELVSLVAPGPIDLALDVGTGTGDLALALGGRAREVIAADLTPGMLAGATSKFARAEMGPWMAPVLADALRLPFPDGTFDVVVSGFVLRNLFDLGAAFREWLRVLKPGGRVGAVEMTHAPGFVRRTLQATQLRFVAPLMARAVGATADDYRYIARSLQHFPDAPRLANLLKAAGFDGAAFRYVMLGSVAIHVASKPLENESVRA